MNDMGKFEITAKGAMSGSKKEVLLYFETSQSLEAFKDDAVEYDLTVTLEDTSKDGIDKHFYFDSAKSKQRWIVANLTKFDNDPSPLTSRQAFDRVFRKDTHPFPGCRSDREALALMIGSDWVKLATEQEKKIVENCKFSNSEQRADHFLAASYVTKNQLINRLKDKGMDDVITFLLSLRY